MLKLTPIQVDILADALEEIDQISDSLSPQDFVLLEALRNSDRGYNLSQSDCRRIERLLEWSYDNPDANGELDLTEESPLTSLYEEIVDAVNINYSVSLSR